MKPKREFRMRLTREEAALVNKHRGITPEGIAKAAAGTELSVSDVKHGWIKTGHQSVFFTNPEYGLPDIDFGKIDIAKILDVVPVVDVAPFSNSLEHTGEFDRFVYTDTHIAMSPDSDGYSQYGGKWDAEEIDYRVEKIVAHIFSNKKSNTIIVDDLGDFMDGFNAKTTRKGHDLPQNMTDQDAFDVGLAFKWKLYVRLAAVYNRLIFNNICNDNHSGAFGYAVNSAFKKMVEMSEHKYATVTNHRKFINHYTIGKNTFVICHGKDAEYLKFGFKPKLDPAQAEKISNYIDHEWLMQKDGRIEFSKGDSHQMLFDWSSNDRFDYFNYPALCPSSSWIQGNFKKGVSGGVLFNYQSTFEYDIKPLFFEWVRN